MIPKEAIARTLEFLAWRKRAFQIAFPDRSKNIVLRDLARRAHVNEDCPHTDPLLIGKWLGRQEMFRVIQRHLYLSPEELFDLYSGVRINRQENDS